MKFDGRRLKLFPLTARKNPEMGNKNEWLVNYALLRKSKKCSPTLESDAKAYQSAVGKNNSDLANKFRGSFLGLAVGDAFGTTLEFCPRNAEENHRVMVGEGPFDLKPGEWTDDTSMALCLAYSLVDLCYFDPLDQLDLYLKWWKEGLFSSTGQCFDIGNTVAEALSRFEESQSSAVGLNDERSAGNGSLMRLCPVVLFYASTPYKAIEYAAESSKTTHANVQAVDACRFFAGLLVGALLNKKKEEILSEMYCPIDQYWDFNPLCSDVEKIARGSYKAKSRDEIQSGGYVIHSLEAALWSFYNTDSFVDGLIKATNLGGDADTVGAIYGQLAGAYYGEIAIPYEMAFSVKNYQWFFQLADEMVAFYVGREVKV